MSIPAGESPIDTPEEKSASDQMKDFANSGEKAVSNEKLLGKFSSTEELAKAYTNLESKLGSTKLPAQDDTPPPPPAASEDEEVKSEEPSLLVEQNGLPEELPSTLVDANKYYVDNGELTDEHYSKIQEEFNLPRTVVDDYIKLHAAASTAISADDMANYKTMTELVGGVDEYKSLCEWADKHWSKTDCDDFDEVMESGHDKSMKMAIKGLQADYKRSHGKLLAGKVSSKPKEIYESKAQVMAAMSDPRYESDPAYRAKVASILLGSPQDNL